MLNRLRSGIAAVVVTGTVVSAGVLVGGSPARAEYPEKPVEMTVLFGGTANTVAQLLTELMSKELGNPVVPVSRPGGGGAIGYTHVQSTRPDGYNIVWNSNSINTVHHLGNLPFGYEAFTPIARVSVEVPVLAVSKDKNWKNLDDMVNAVKESDKPINVGISGKGSFTHLTSAALFDAMGIADKVNYISYGDGKAPVELLAGRIDAAIQWPGQFVSFVESGDVVVLASTAAEKVELIPGLKTAQEQGYDIDISMWRGIAAPKGTPPEVVKKLETTVQATVESEEFQKASRTIGFEPAFMGSEEFGELIARDDKFYADLLKQLGLAE